MSDFRDPRDPFYRDLNGPAEGTGYHPVARDTIGDGLRPPPCRWQSSLSLRLPPEREPKHVGTGDTTRLAATRMAPRPESLSPPAPASVPAPDPNRP